MAKSRIAGYLKGSERIGGTGILTDFNGRKIGVYTVVSKWGTPKSHISSVMLQVDAKVGSVVYTGRSAGNLMLFKGKRKARR